MEQLGRFRILRELGAGAFGTVYLAHDPQLDREVALKVPHAEVLTNPQRVERFLREAKAAARLRHPHILPLYEAGQVAGTYYLSAAYIEGQPLADAIPEDGLDCDQAARIVLHLAEALAYAHRQGVIHRDLKPANVLLDEQGTPHVLDFGLATRREDWAARKLTQLGAVLGTPAYMAPEQVQGEAEEASDQYSLGVILYELLTGRTPFVGGSVSVLAHVLKTEPPPPSQYRQDIPPDLEAICLRCLRKEPAQRYADCAQLAAALRHYLDRAPEPRPVRWGRAQTLRAALLLVLLLGLSGIGLTARHAATRVAEANRATAQVEAAEALANSHVDHLQRVKLAQAEADRATDRANRQEEQARQAEAAFRNAASRNPERLQALRAAEEWAVTHTFARHTGPVTCLAINPAGIHVVSGSFRKDALGEIRVWEVHTGQERAVFRGHAAELVRVAFSPEGNRVLSSSRDGRHKLWDWEQGRELFEFICQTDYCFPPVGNRLLAQSWSDTVSSWDTQTGQELPALSKATARGAVYSPASKRIVTFGAERTVRVWDAEKGTELHILRGHQRQPSGLAISPDGQRIASWCGPHRPIFGSPEPSELIVWDAVRGEGILLFEPGKARDASFTPDGTRVRVRIQHDAAIKPGCEEFDATTGRHLRTVTAEEFLASRGKSRLQQRTEDMDGLGGAVLLMALRREVGTMLPPHKLGAYLRSGLTVRPLPDPEVKLPLFNLQGHAGALRCAVMTWDGERFISGSDEGTLKVWEPRHADSERRAAQLIARHIERIEDEQALARLENLRLGLGYFIALKRIAP